MTVNPQYEDMVIDLKGESDGWLYQDTEDREPLRYGERQTEEELVQGAVDNGILQYGACMAYMLEGKIDF